MSSITQWTAIKFNSHTNLVVPGLWQKAYIPRHNNNWKEVQDYCVPVLVGRYYLEEKSNKLLSDGILISQKEAILLPVSNEWEQGFLFPILR